MTAGGAIAAAFVNVAPWLYWVAGLSVAALVWSIVATIRVVRRAPASP